MNDVGGNGEVRSPRPRLPRRRLTPAEVAAARRSSYQPRTPEQEQYEREYSAIVQAFVARHDLHEAEVGDETPEQRAELDAELAALAARYSHLG